MLCFLSGQRAQTIEALNTDFIYVDEEIFVFYVPLLLKTSRPKFHQKPLEYKAYHEKGICPVTFINT